MDFYAHQDRAKAASRRLTALFALSLLAVVGAVNGAAMLGWLAVAGGSHWPPYFLATNTFVTLLIVFGGAWVELHRLRENGAALAERLGARVLDESLAPHRRLRDVAEEVAIGAGVPVPALYVLGDDSINALAAGERPGLAAVMVTRGALERLRRAELQGVVAHEFAHIVGGDAWLNTRLTGALYGLYSLRLAGFKLLGAAASAEAGSPWRLGVLRVAALVAGVLLSAVGMLGVLAAQVLKAGISRQREFLADALAVQITRDRDGLGSALRRIAGEQQVPLRSDYASLVSHFLLVQPAGLRDWFDTHPTLAERIRRLYGRRMPALAPASGEVADVARIAPGDAGAAGAPGGIDDTLPFVNFTLSSSDPALAMAAARCARGRPGHAARGAGRRSAHAGRLGADHADPLRVAGRRIGQPMAGRAGVGARVRRARRHAARGIALAGVAGRRIVATAVARTAARARAPLEQRAPPRVARSLPPRAVECDGHVHSAEWVYYTLARHRLLPNGAHLARQRRAPASKLAQSRALAALFAMAAAVGEASARTTRDALAEAATVLEVPPPASTPDEVGTTELALALDTLLRLPPLDKPVLLKALVGLARTPGDPNYDAFVRAVAAAIDCPAPRGAGRQIGTRRGEPELAALV